MTSHEEHMIRKIKSDYPKGTCIELIYMDDPYAKLPPRTPGVVEIVDDIGTIHVNWDNGSTLGLVPGIDRFRKVMKPLPTRRFSRKPGDIEELKVIDHTDSSRKVVIEKVIELDPVGFKHFSENLHEDYDFIHDCIPLMGMDLDTLTCHCVLIKEVGASDGILVESEGYDYARYAAYWDGGYDNGSK